ncbi:MAG: hypothetical protein KC492_20075 [Myxococcales bacterium]|nr:hypothetical protein [Myxococcales bacterium]
MPSGQAPGLLAVFAAAELLGATSLALGAALASPSPLLEVARLVPGSPLPPPEETAGDVDEPALDFESSQAICARAQIESAARLSKRDPL